jgi:hypothetical protein
MVIPGGYLNTSVLSPVIESGAVNSPAAAGTNVMDACGKHWPADVFQHFILEIYGGPGSPQVRVIESNAGSSLIIEGTWEIALAKGSKFRIFACDPKLSGEVSAIEAKLDDPASGLAALHAELTPLTTRLFQETAPATNADGTNWVDLLDRSTIAKPVRICGFRVIVAGGWAGKCQIRIVDGAGTTKIFPFAAQLVQDTDFVSGTQYAFSFPCDVSVSKGYKLQFNSTNAADGAGKTLQLNNLDVMELS